MKRKMEIGDKAICSFCGKKREIVELFTHKGKVIFESCGDCATSSENMKMKSKLIEEHFEKLYRKNKSNT
jgi:hypothetical protein